MKGRHVKVIFKRWNPGAKKRDLIIHGSAHRGANGVAMPTDEDDQDGLFFYNHPERGGQLRRLGARSRYFCCLDPIPH